MKTLLSFLVITISSVVYSQNLTNNVAIQQQVNQFNNINVDNNVGNYNVNPSRLSNQINTINRANLANVQQVRSRGNRGNRNLRVQKVNDNVSNDVAINTIPVINKQENEQQIQLPQVAIPSPSLNVNVNLPSINLSKKVKEISVKEKKDTPKRMEDFRIKTGGSSASGSTSHKSKKGKKNLKKKVLRPIKCWMKRTFKSNIKFHFSCECFQF